MKPSPPATRYRLLEQIGQGGMAQVFRALALGPHGFEKLVALKRVLPAFAGDPEFVERFIDEAKLAAQLSHANVVQVLDFGYMDDALYLAMELVEGLDLRGLQGALRRAGGEVPVDVAVAIGIAVLQGLAHAHDKTGFDGRPLGVVHCDLSPSNVLVSRDGEVKLADFGIARANAPRLRSLDGVVAGKVPYMAPEQFAARLLDARTDLYGVGVVLYELVTGRRPFEGDVAAIAAAAGEGRVERPSLARPGLPPSLDAPILAALAADPTSRPPTARAMLRDLVDARRVGGLSDDPLLLQGTMREIAPRASPPAELPLVSAHETAVLSLMVTPSSPAGTALPTRATRDLGPPLPTRRSRLAAVVAIIAIVLAVGAWAASRLGEAPTRLPGRISAPAGDVALTGAARRAGARIDRALAALPDEGVDVRGRLARAGAEARLTVVASAHGRRSQRNERGAPDVLVNRATAIVADALADLLSRPVVLPRRGGPTAAAVRAYNEAAVAVSRGDGDTAAQRLDSVLAAEPRFGEAAYLRTMCAWHVGEEPPAAVLAVARRALAGDAHALAVVDTAEQFMAGRFAEAARAAERGLQRFPRDADLELFLGEALLHAGDFDRGIAHLEAIRGRTRFIALASFHGVQHAQAIDDHTGFETWVQALRAAYPRSERADVAEASWTLRHGDAAAIERLARRPDLSRFDPDGHVRFLLAARRGDFGIEGALSATAVSAAATADRGKAASLLARLALVRWRVDERARWRRVAGGLLSGDPFEEAAEAALAGLEAPAPVATPGPGRFTTLARAVLASAHGGPAPAQVGEREVDAVLLGIERLRAGRLDEAGAALRGAVARPTNGVALPLAGFLRAWIDREARDDAGVVAGCDEVLRPRGTPLYVPALLPRCLRWSAAAEQSLGHGARAAELRAWLARLLGDDRGATTRLDATPFEIATLPPPRAAR